MTLPAAAAMTLQSLSRRQESFPDAIWFAPPNVTQASIAYGRQWMAVRAIVSLIALLIPFVLFAGPVDNAAG